MTTKPAKIVIFAKAPIAGFAKTRLIPALGALGAAKLAERMLRHTVAQALATKAEVELCVSPEPSANLWAALYAEFRIQAPSLLWQAQGDGELGERLSRASKRVSAQHCVIFIGSDCPALSSTLLEAAMKQLQRFDTVMIPSTDGGYVLLGLRQHAPDLFSDVPWSTAQVAAVTRLRIQALGWTLAELSPLRDIDEPADLQQLAPHWLDDIQTPFSL